MGQPAGVGGHGRDRPDGPEVLEDPGTDERQAALRLQRLPIVAQHVVELADPPEQPVVQQARGGHRRADQGLVDDGRVEVEDPLPEPHRRPRPPRVGDMRRQQRDVRAGSAVLPTLQVVADGALVHDDERPGRMGVRGVHVLHEPGVKYLGDPRNRRAPGRHPLR